MEDEEYEDTSEEQDETVEEPIEEDDSRVYWALRDADDVIAALREKQDEYYTACQRSNLTTVWRIAYAQYYGTNPDNPGELATQRIKRVGEEKEFTRFRVNEFRSFVKQAIQTALGQRPAFKATAINSNFVALAGVKTADRAVNYVMGEALPEWKRRQWLEIALVLGGSWAHLRWDSDGGDDTEELIGEPPLQTPVPTTSGEPVIDILCPWEQYHDPREKEPSWRTVREERSKWELAALYPEHAEELIGMGGGSDEYSLERLWGMDVFGGNDDDKVILEHFYLPRSSFAPEGRYIGFVEELVLWDRPLPLKNRRHSVPVYELIPSRYVGRAFGYSDRWDWMAIQEMIDSVVSDVASVIRAYGRTPIVADKGSGVNWDAWAKGLTVVEKNPGAERPAYIEPPEVPSSTMEFIGYLHRRMESVSQQNAVRRGDPQANIKSGTMAALFNQQAIEFLNDVQESFDGAMTALANGVLEMLRSRSKGEFMIKVAGHGEEPYWQAFQAQAGLGGVHSVHMETASPMLRSASGNFEIFQAVSQVPEQDRGKVMRGLERGDWTGYAQVDQSCDLRIVAENEALLRGEIPEVAMGDHPEKHVREHWALFEKLMASGAGPEAITPILQHVTKHIETWQAIDPRLSMLLGLPPPPPMPGSPTGDLMMMGMSQPPMPTNDAAPPPTGGEVPNSEPQGAPPQPKPAEPAQPPSEPV